MTDHQPQQNPDCIIAVGGSAVPDPKELPSVMERWQGSVSTGDPFEMTFPLKGADGIFCWFLTRVTPVRNSKSEVIRWFGTNTDVDDLRQIREALQESEGCLSFALAAAEMGTFDGDVATGRLLWSAQTLAHHGLKPEDFRDDIEHSMSLMHPEDRVRVRSVIDASVVEGRPYRAEYG